MPSGTITQAQTYTDTLTGSNRYYSSANVYQNQNRSRFTISAAPSSGSATVTNTNNSSSHTVTYNPGNPGTYTFTVQERVERSQYDSFSEFWFWVLQSTSTTTYTITVNADLPSPDTSVTVNQSFTSGTSATATVSGSGGTSGTVTYLLKTSSSTPSTGASGWQTSNSFTGLTRGTTYYGWTKRTNTGGAVVSVRGSKTMGYNPGSTSGFITNPSSTVNNLIELGGSESTFLVKFRLLSSTSQYRVVRGSTVARNWFTPNSSESSSTGVNVSISQVGAGTYTLQSRRPVANGGDGTTITNADTVTVTIPVSGSINSTSVVVPGGTVSVTGTVLNLSSGTNIDWTVKRNDTNATINSGTVTTTEDNESIAVSVAAPNNGSTSIGYTLSWSGGAFSGSATTTTTILQGYISYATKNATSGNVAVSASGNYSSIGTWTENSSATTINTSGTLTWLHNEGSAARTSTVGATISLGGVSRTISTTASQQGGATVGLSYANVNSNVTTQGDTTTGTHSSVSYAKQSGDAAGSVNASTGVVTWSSVNEGTANRSITVRATASRNGDTDTVDATATQLGGASVSGFCYATKNATSGDIDATITATGTVAYARQSGSTACTVNASTGKITWTHNEGTGARTATIRATVTRNGDTDTADAVATQQGGASVSLSYSNIAASGGEQAASTGGTHSSISYAKQSGDANATVDTTTGAVTWPHNEAATSRACVVRATASRNGDTDTVDATATQLAGSSVTAFSYATKNATSGSVTPTITGTYSSISYAKHSGSSAATVNTTTGEVTWTHNEGTGGRSCVVRVTVVNNGDTDTADATSSQQGGASVTLSYANKNSRSGDVSPTVGGTHSSISYSKQSGDANGTVNASTGIVTWATNNESTANRAITVRATVSRNGDTDTVDATCTQLGGASVSLSYSNISSGTTTSDPTVGGTHSSISYSKVSGDANGTVDESTGVVTFPVNEGGSNRSILVRASATRNGDTNTADATATQLAGTNGTFSYGTKNATAGSISPTISGTYSGVTFSKESGSTAATVDESTGAVTWTKNEGTAGRSCVVRGVFTQSDDSDTVDVTCSQQPGSSVSLSYASVNPDESSQSPTIVGTYATVSYSKLSGDANGTVDTSTGVVTWTGDNTSTNSREISVRATVNNNGDVDTADATAIQLGTVSGSVIYPNQNATAGTITPILDGNYTSVSFAKISTQPDATLNTSTGVVTWPHNESFYNRSVLIRATFTRNGQTTTDDDFCTQLGGSELSGFSYPNQSPAAGTVSKTLTSTGTVTYSKVTTQSAATLDTSTGDITWAANTGAERSVTIRATATRNGDTDTLDAVATQLAPSTLTASIGSVASTTPVEGTSDALTGSATLDSGVTITSWSWSSTGPISLSSTNSQNTTATFTNVTADSAGSVTLEVTDSLGRTASDTQNFTILLDNQVPVAVLSAPGSGQVGEAVDVSGSGSSDADGHSLTYAYTATDGTNSFNRAASSTATWSFTPTVAGTYTVTLTVNDGYTSVNAQQDVIVSVVNNPPTDSTGGYGVEIIKANGDVSLNGNELLIRYAGNLDVSSGSGSTNVTVPESATEVLPIGSGATNSSSASGVEYTVTGTTTKTVSVTDNGSASEVGLFIFK